MPDTVIRNATIIDGTGGKAYEADLAIAGDRIEAIGKLDGLRAASSIDARGLVVCPGIIDVHSHADMSIHRRDHHEILEPLVRQGITTFVGGNCGMSLAPLGENHRDLVRQYVEAFTAFDFAEEVSWNGTGEFLDELERRGVLLNCAMLAPHGLLRIDAQGFEGRLATEDEVKAMERALEASLEEGAVGLSAGLQYFPGLKSDTAELVRLGAVLKKYDGVFACHLRSYSNTLGRAVGEVLEVARRNDVHGQVSHIFWMPDMGPLAPAFRRVVAALARASAIYPLPAPLDYEISRQLARLERERRRGVNVIMDVMPTTTAFTHLLAFYPPWVLRGSREEAMKRLADSALRRRMLRDILKGKMVWPHLDDDAWTLNMFKLMGWRSLRIMSVQSERNKRYEGRQLVEMARDRGKHPFDAACDLLLEEDGQVLIFNSIARPEDSFTERCIFAAIRDPEVAVSTDTILLGFGKPSYLFYAAYPKLFGRYVREKKMLSLETAVRKVTGLPARHFHLKQRGELKEKNYADILVFNPETIAPKATFEDPRVFPRGIEHVFINGKHVLNEGEMNLSERHGRVLRRGA